MSDSLRNSSFIWGGASLWRALYTTFTASNSISFSIVSQPSSCNVIMSHFSYCPLVWMFHDRASNNKINKIHERALRIIHKDSTSNFQELLNKSNSVSVHQRNLQLLLTEIYKTVHNLNPTFMTQVFEKKDVSYNLRESNSLTLPKANTTLYGIDTVRYIGKKLWQVLPTEIKESKSLEVFKQKIKLIKNFDCSCRLCKNFVPSLGFV